MAKNSEARETDYDIEEDINMNKEETNMLRKENRDKRIEAGQSKRIWGELYKVLDASDVVCVVLDARDPNGTRCKHVEKHLKKNCPTKHLIFVLNKVDLVPTSCTKKWIIALSKIAPTIACSSRIKKPFGKQSLLRLIHQFDILHKDKKTISVGLIGYPNVGKSSVINTMKDKMVCKAAPVPGETKIWQYVSLTKRVYMIDCPGIVYDNENCSDVDIVLKGVVRAERIIDPSYYITEMLRRVEPTQMTSVYGISSWTDAQDFLDQFARKSGRLLKGGDPDISTAAKMLLHDWQRGRILYYNMPTEEAAKPDIPSEDEEEEKEDGDQQQ